MEILGLGYIDSRQSFTSSKKGKQTRIHHRHTMKQRARLIFLLAVFVIGLGIGMVFDGSTAAASSSIASYSTTAAKDTIMADIGTSALQYEVQIGDTLWQIAKQHKPESMHIHSYLDRLKQLNGITDSVLYEGMFLILP